MHPVRLRVLHAASQEEVTPRTLAARLPDVPQASLYRNIKVLLEHGALEVVRERTVNGIVESTYRTSRGVGRLSREEFASMPPEEHRRIFALMLGEMSGLVEDYFSRPDYDTTEEGMTYFFSKLILTDEQRQQFRLDLIDLIERHSKLGGEGARPTTLGVVLAPLEEK
jgi:DNA-binding transcriptional ArsR family regulator